MRNKNGEEGVQKECRPKSRQSFLFAPQFSTPKLLRCDTLAVIGDSINKTYVSLFNTRDIYVLYIAYKNRKDEVFVARGSKQHEVGKGTKKQK